MDIFFIAFFGFAFWGYARLIYKFFRDFTKVLRFFFIAFFNQKKPFFFPYGSQLFLLLTLCSLFFITLSYSHPKVYHIFIIVSDDKMHRRDKKIPMENKRRGHSRSQGGTRATTLRVCFELSK